MARKRSTQRYYSVEDQEVGVTRSQLRRLGKTRQLEYMTYWFESMFEDPSNETPHNSREGGFQYIWGGPYDAADQLGGEFGGVVSDERIEEAVEEVQSEGIYDWAPSSNHPDREMIEGEARDEDRPDDLDESDELEAIIQRLEGGSETRFGDEGEVDRRRAILAWLDALRIVLEAAAPTHGGIGHNNPPSDEETDTKQLAELRRLEALIRAELDKPEPEALEVAKATSKLRAAAGWAGKKADIAVDSFAKSFGESAGKAMGTAAGTAAVGGITLLAGAVITTVISWLTYVTWPF